MRSNRLSVVVIMGLLLPACGKQGDSETPKPEESVGEPNRAVTVALGDCAGPNTFFESGPRPVAFDRERVEAQMRARVSTEEIKDHKKPPPKETRKPPPSKEKSPTSTGSKMALDEGKMGKKESTRATGQYAMKKLPKEGKFASLTGSADFTSGLDDRSVYGGRVGKSGGRGSFATRGGGGRGWGTIGKGRYGTIGHIKGSGSGYGPGGARRGKSAVPQVRIGNAKVTGDLDKNIIRRYVRRRLARIRNCYEKQLLVTPTLGGTLTVSFQIDASGVTRVKKTNGKDLAKIHQCVAAVYETIRFPKPKGGGVVDVTYPLHFIQSSGEQEPAPKANAKAKTKAKPTAEPAAHVPGTKSVFAGREAALTSCIQKQRQRRHGGLVAEFQVDGQGAVSEVTIHGWGDSAVDDCVAKLVKSATFASKERRHRCPVAFGPMSLAQAPGIDVSSASVTLRALPGEEARELAKTKELLYDTSMEWKIRPLFHALRTASLVRRRHVPKSLISISGPLVLRVEPTVPMKAVIRVLKTVEAAGLNILLTIKEGRGWRYLPRVGLPAVGTALPVAPVPLSHGAWWGYPSTFRPLGRLADEEPGVRASVLLTAKEIWVGLNVGDRRQLIKVDGQHDWKGLYYVLAEYRDMKPFEGRSDLEFAGEDDVPYSDVSAAIEVGTKLGFEQWTLFDPASLSVRFKE